MFRVACDCLLPQIAAEIINTDAAVAMRSRQWSISTVRQRLMKCSWWSNMIGNDWNPSWQYLIVDEVLCLWKWSRVMFMMVKNAVNDGQEWLESVDSWYKLIFVTYNKQMINVEREAQTTWFFYEDFWLCKAANDLVLWLVSGWFYVRYYR